MTKPLHPLALFRLSVLGPLASRDRLERGELKKLFHELAQQTYNIPGSKRTHLSPQAIERWFYAWQRGSIEALVPKTRADKGSCQLTEQVQTALLAAKRENPARSLRTLIRLLEGKGLVARGTLARTTVHRFLQRHQLSRQTPADAVTIERRAFVAERANQIWHGDVMHGPTISTLTGLRKTYLVSLMDDASRLIAHADFCWGETALDIEGVLQSAILKRGIPNRIILDNGAAYTAHSLAEICARLEIRLVFCPAYEPQGKGKLERYHRTFRSQFLSEIQLDAVDSLGHLNGRLWAWLEQSYHRTPHEGLDGQTPLARWQQDLAHLRTLTPALNAQFDDIFLHRVKRFVRKDGSLSWEGKFFEVPYQYAGQTVYLVFDPHFKQAVRIESKSYENLGAATPLDRLANTHRSRQRPVVVPNTTPHKRQFDAIEMAHDQYNAHLTIHDKKGD